MSLETAKTKPKRGMARVHERIEESVIDAREDPYTYTKWHERAMRAPLEKMKDTTYEPWMDNAIREMLGDPNLYFTMGMCAAALWTTHQTLYEWIEKYPSFGAAYAQGRSMQENNIARKLIEGKYSNGTQFFLKNVFPERWKDKFEQETTIQLGSAVREVEQGQRAVQWATLDQPPKQLKASDEDEDIEDD